MASVIMLDTHVVLWLYAKLLDLFPAEARDRLERDELTVSPVVELELRYLFEIGRVSEPPKPVLAALGQTLGLRTADESFAAVVSNAMDLDWTRDPFDRLLAAHALTAQASLLTKDATLRKHLPLAVWDESE